MVDARMERPCRRGRGAGPCESRGGGGEAHVSPGAGGGGACEAHGGREEGRPVLVTWGGAGPC